MGESILTDTKMNLGIAEENKDFDDVVMGHINTTFSILQQIGVGPDDGYVVEDDSDEWFDFIGEDNSWNMIRSYVFLKVKSLFDPANTSFNLTAMKEEIEQLEYRISINREWLKNPVDPMDEEEDEDDDDDG